jgi:hypothetical protein
MTVVFIALCVTATVPVGMALWEIVDDVRYKIDEAIHWWKNDETL